MSSLSKINKLNKNKRSFMTKSIFLIGLIAEATQGMESENSFSWETRSDRAELILDETEESGDAWEILERSKTSYKNTQYDESILYGKQAVEMAEDDLYPDFFLIIAKAHTKLGNHDEADNFIDLAIENSKNESNCEWMFNCIAKFLTKAGRVEDAKEYKEMAMQESAIAALNEQVKYLKVAVLSLATEYNNSTG